MSHDPRVRRALRWALRVLRVLGIAALALEALYVVAVNVFLSTSLFDKVVNATPDAADIRFARGWSVFPTRIHATHLSIRGTDSHIEWILRLDRVTFECSLRALLRKELRVTMAHGSGVTFRLRFKVASPADTAEHERELPAIDSLGPVGFIPSDPPYAGEWNDKDWHLWTVSIEGANAEHVREVWIEDARFTGDADVTGGFYLKPIRSAEVGPATVVVRSGSVAVDSRIVADHLVAEAHVLVARFDPRTADTVLREVSLSTDASLEVPDLANLEVAGDGAPLLSGTVTVPTVALRIVDGVLRDGSALHASAPDATVDVPACAVSGAVTVTAGVEHDVLAGRVVVERIRACAAVEAPLLTAALDSADLALEAPFGDLHAVVDLPDVQLADAARLQDVLPKAPPVRVIGGTLHGAAHAEAWRKDQRVVGRGSLDGKSLHLAYAKLGLRGDVRASVDVARWDSGAQTANGKGEVTIEHLTGSFAPHGAAPDFADWRGDLKLDGGRLQLGQTPRLEVEATVHARDAKPILELVLGEALSPLVASLTEMPSLTAVAHFAALRHEAVISDLLASGGSLSLRGTALLRPDDAGGADGAFVVHKGPLSVGFDLDSHGSHLRLFDLDAWYRARLREVADRQAHR